MTASQEPTTREHTPWKCDLIECKESVTEYQRKVIRGGLTLTGLEGVCIQNHLLNHLDRAVAERDAAQRISVEDNEALQEEVKLREQAEARVKVLEGALARWSDPVWRTELRAQGKSAGDVIASEARAALKGDQP